ncbi:MAG: DUF11 domain-containing protein [Candidatus Goldbacteria bacterium]|nr:DUF11 domain-containing protein [Candidatus Goldiibacteriota bacterium]
MGNKNLLKLLNLINIFLFILISNIFSVVTLDCNAISMPSTAALDSDITIEFTITHTGGALRFSVSLTDNNTPLTGGGADSNCKHNWLANEKGIYRGSSFAGSSTSWWIDGVQQTATALKQTDTWGASSGLVIDNDANPGTYKVRLVVHLPPEHAGSYYIHIAAGENGQFATTCCSTSGNVDAQCAKAINITGIPFIKADLQMCNAGSVISDKEDNSCSGDEYRMRFRIYNWSESGVWMKGFSFQYCVYDPNGDWDTTQPSTNFQMYDASNNPQCGVYNPATTGMISQTYTDCGSGRRVNWCYRLTFQNMTQKPFLIPPNGGYMQSGSPHSMFRRTGSRCLSDENDYSRIAEAPNCGSGYSDLKEVPLFYDNVHVCEYESGSTPDAETGMVYCYSSENCGSYLKLFKSVNVTQATLGQTITYCITVTNTSGSTVTFNLWDTLPTVLDYVGCDNSCSVLNTGGRTIVSWTISNLAPSGSATRCFWGVVARYPWNPLYEKRSIFALLNRYFLDYYKRE